MKQYIQTALHDLFYIWKQELKQVFRDSGVMIFFFLVPLAYPVLYGLIYNPEVVHEVKMLVVDHSATASSREFVRRIEASPDVRVAAYCQDMEEAKALLDAKKGYGILYIPSSFSSDIHTGKQTTVNLYCDMGALLYYKAILLSTTEASLAMGADIRLANQPGSVSASLDEVIAYPVVYESVALYNTQNGFSSFLLPGILILVIQQTMLLGVGMLAGTARERNRFRSLIPVSKHYSGTLRVILGKALAYFIIYTLVSAWALMVVPAIFELPRLGSFSSLVLFSLPYIFSCIFLSMTLSCLITGRETPMLAFVFASVPLLFLSGISWPQSAIPVFWKWVSYLFPSTFGVQAFVKVNSMGASLPQIDFEFKGLWILTIFYFVTTWFLYRKQIVAARKQRSLMHSVLKNKRKGAATLPEQGE